MGTLRVGGRRHIIQDKVTMWSEGFSMDKVCFCCNIDVRIQFLIASLSVCRLAGLVCGGFYGPWFYLVLTLDILYLGADFLVIYSLFWKKDDGKPSCDFTNQKVWIFIWQVLNIFGILGLCAALVWYLEWLKLWGMLHTPVHFVVFLIILCMVPVMVCTSFVLLGLYRRLKEAYIDAILGKRDEDDGEPGLTSGGRRISV